MKSLISLSLAGLSLQGIILGQQPIITVPNTGLVNQVNQIPIRTQSPHHFPRFNPLYSRYQVNPINVIRPVQIIPQPLSTFVQPIQPIVQPFPQIVQPIVQPVQQIVNPIDTAIVVPQNQCRISGVYKQLCLPKDIMYGNEMTPITYNRKYECYSKAVCAFKDNKCQWFKTMEYKRCMRKVKEDEALSQMDNDSYYS